MQINSDINILGGLSDWNLIHVFLNQGIGAIRKQGGLHAHTAIKTDKSVSRFEKSISSTLIHFKNRDTEALIRSILTGEGISADSLLVLFWNASVNNELLDSLNQQVFFPAFYSGRVAIKADEVVSCLKELRETEAELKKWADSTLQTSAGKYLTLMKKFHLMEGTNKKTILRPFLSDKLFVLFVYWISATEAKANLLESDWLNYALNERTLFIERAMQKRFSRYFQISYTGDQLKVETMLPYSKIYDAIQ